MRGCEMIGWDGRLIRRLDVPYSHLGDIAYADGKIYGVFGLHAPGRRKYGSKGLIKVWDAKLNPIREKPVDAQLDGAVVFGEDSCSRPLATTTLETISVKTAAKAVRIHEGAKNEHQERVLEGVAIWASYYRANIHRFVEDYFHIQLKLFHICFYYETKFFHEENYLYHNKL